MNTYTFYQLHLGNERYIGKTTQSVAGRVARHKFRAKDRPEMKISKAWNKSKQVIVEVLDVKQCTPQHAAVYEQLLIKGLTPQLNVHYAKS